MKFVVHTQPRTQIFNRYVLKIDNAKVTFFLDSDFR